MGIGAAELGAILEIASLQGTHGSSKRHEEDSAGQFSELCAPGVGATRVGATALYLGRRRPATQRTLGLPLHAANLCLILNHMVQYPRAHLDVSFAALSDATRRDILEQLGRADASITDLAEKFHMTLTGMKKHISVLEQAGLVTTEKVGRVRTCKLGLRGLADEAAWIERYQQLWDARFDELDKVIEELKRKEKVDGRKKRE